jgi:hypothetical protein
MLISAQCARPATAQRPAAVANVWRNSRLLLAALLIALFIDRPTRADDEAGSFRIHDQKIVPASNAEPAETQLDPTGYPVPVAPGSPPNSEVAQALPPAPTQGTTTPATGAPVQGAPNGQVSGPVLEITGNPIVDWWRDWKFERELDNQCQDDYCPKCHKHHALGHCSLDPAHCHGNGTCDDCGHCWLRNLCCCRQDGPFGEACLDCHCYHRNYPVNPWYFDPRDGRVYAAYGFGAPMTVPLAPTVTQQYNYGWGIPSSRITPISRIAPEPTAIRGAVAPY